MNTLRCWCVLPNEEGTSLLVRTTDSGLAMASFDLPKNRLDFFPDQVLNIHRAAWDELKADVTVRRHLHANGDVQICLLELQAPLETVPDGYRWIDAEPHWAPNPEDPDWDLWVDDYVWKDEVSAKAWATWKLVFRTEDRQAPWEQIGWFGYARDWMLEKLKELKIRPIGPVEQLKGAWGWSSILRVDTDRGGIYLKAAYRRRPYEADVLSVLGDLCPTQVPSVLAADHDKNWVLMSQFPGICLELLGDEEHVQAVTTFARLQRSTVEHMDRLREIKVRDTSPASIARSWDKLSQNRTFLSGFKEGLKWEDYAALDLVIPRIKELLEQLGQSSLPLVLANEDFRPGNIRLHEENFLFFDWTSAVIAHPFFGLNYFLNRLIRDPKFDGFHWRVELNEHRRQFRDAYLAEWTDYAPMNRLIEEFWMCRRLYYLYEAIFSYTDLIYLDSDTPWTNGSISHMFNCLRQLPTAIQIIDAMEILR